MPLSAYGNKSSDKWQFPIDASFQLGGEFVYWDDILKTVGKDLTFTIGARVYPRLFDSRFVQDNQYCLHPVSTFHTFHHWFISIAWTNTRQYSSLDFY